MEKSYEFTQLHKISSCAYIEQFDDGSGQFYDAFLELCYVKSIKRIY